MSKFMRKAFTLVELLVVVAILAILASVAIIGYSSFTKKAQQSVDEQAVTQMNTMLLGLDQLNLPEDINEFYEQMRTAGLSAKDYKPLYTDRYFFWDKDINQVVYTDKSYTVLYPEKLAKDTTVNKNNHQWYSLSGKIDTSSSNVNVSGPISVNSTPTTLTANTAADFAKLAEYTQTNTSTATTTTALNLKVELNNDIDLMGADTTFIESKTEKAKVEFIGGTGNDYSVIKGLYVSDNHSYIGTNSQGQRGTYGNAMFNAVSELTVKNIVIDGATIGSSSNTRAQAAIFAGKVTNKATFENVTLRNCTLYGGKKSGLLFGFFESENSTNISFTNVKIENCTVYAGNGEVGLVTGCVYNSDGNTNYDVDSTDITITNSNVKLMSNLVTYEYQGRTYVKDPVDATETWRVGISTYGFVKAKNAGNTSVSSTSNLGNISWNPIVAYI